MVPANSKPDIAHRTRRQAARAHAKAPHARTLGGQGDCRAPMSGGCEDRPVAGAPGQAVAQPDRRARPGRRTA
jgi:hypothetical protein